MNYMVDKSSKFEDQMRSSSFRYEKVNTLTINTFKRDRINSFLAHEVKRCMSSDSVKESNNTSLSLNKLPLD